MEITKHAYLMAENAAKRYATDLVEKAAEYARVGGGVEIGPRHIEKAVGELREYSPSPRPAAWASVFAGFFGAAASALVSLLLANAPVLASLFCLILCIAFLGAMFSCYRRSV